MGNIITIFILSLLGIFSFIACAIIMERIIFLSKNRINTQFYRSFLPDRINELKQSLASSRKPLVFEPVLLMILKTNTINRAELKERLDGQFTELYLLYHKRINLLGIFAKLSTLIGLLGTVTGMIQSFNNIVEKGISTASIVASGISQALITTAAGLIIAIPATFFYEYFNEKIDHEIRKMEIITSDLISTLIDKSRSWGSLK